MKSLLLVFLMVLGPVRMAATEVLITIEHVGAQDSPLGTMYLSNDRAELVAGKGDVFGSVYILDDEAWVVVRAVLAAGRRLDIAKSSDFSGRQVEFGTFHITGYGKSGAVEGFDYYVDIDRTLPLFRVLPDALAAEPYGLKLRGRLLGLRDYMIENRGHFAFSRPGAGR